MSIKRFSPVLYELAGVLLASGAFAAVLLAPIPPVFVYTQFSNLLLAVALTPVLIWSFRLTGWLGRTVGLAATLVLFAIPLSMYWANVSTHASLVGGLLPWQDANYYYGDARRLLSGSLMTEWAGRRPVFNAALAVLLGLTRQNLQAALAVMALLVGLSCYLAAREIQRTHGTLAAVVLLNCLFLFSGQWVIGLVLSENLGLLMGNFALIAVWRGSSTQRPRLVWLGMFFLTFALVTRAGAFAALPLMVIAGMWVFGGQKHFSVTFGIGAVLVVFLGFGCSAILSRYLVEPGAIPNANFSYTLYGLAYGGGGYRQAMLEHPEAGPQQVYQLAFEQIKSHPSQLLLGLTKGWILYFKTAFNFIGPVPAWMTQVWWLRPLVYLNFGRRFLWLLIAAGFWVCWQRRTQPLYPLLAANIMGILATAPLLAEDGGFRVFAATDPFFFAMIALGLVSLAARLKWADSFNQPQDQTWPRLSPALGIGMMLIVLIGPFWVYAASQPVNTAGVNCAAGQISVSGNFAAGSSIRLVDEFSGGWQRLPEVRVQDFRSSNPAADGLGFRTGIMSLTVGNTLYNLLNFDTHQTLWLVIPPGQAPDRPGNYASCAVLLDATFQLYSLVSPLRYLDLP